MIHYPICRTIYLFLFAWLLFNACNGQPKSVPLEVIDQSVASGIKVIGTLPPLVPQHNPYNDTGLVAQYIRTIFQDSKGNYWFGPAGQSVVKFDGETLHYIRKEEFYQGNEAALQADWSSVHATTEDQKGNIWFGTEYGVVKYDGQSFRSYTQKHGLSNLNVGRKSILVDQVGDIWVGTKAGVFHSKSFAKNEDNRVFTPFNLLPKLRIQDIMEDDSGNLWFASKDEGVFRYDGKTITNFNEIVDLGENVAGGIAQDKAGNLWFTMENGICRYDGNDFKRYPINDGLGKMEIWGLLIEDSGIIWITARGSTTRFDPTLPASDPAAFQVFKIEDGINCCVQSMHQDRTGKVWWGSGQGLHRFDGQQFYKVKRDGPWD